MKRVINYFQLSFFVLIFVLLISNLIFLNNISNKLEKFQEKIYDEIKVNTEKIELKIEESNKDIFQKQEIISELIYSTYENTTLQIKQSQNINETYSKVLEETKKKINHKFEEGYNEIPKLKEAAISLYDNKKYLEAYNKFKNVLFFEEDNHEIRNMLIKSLYYLNPANTTNYTEILDEINKLKSTVFCDAEIEKIENIIKMERGEIDE